MRQSQRWGTYYIAKRYQLTDAGRWADAIQFVKDRAGKGWLFEINYEGL